MLHIIHQAQDQGERVGQGIAYIGGTALAALAGGMQDIPSASPEVVDLTLIAGVSVVVGRFLLDVLKWRDGRSRRDKSGKDDPK